MATVDAAAVTKMAADTHARVTPSPALPIAKPAAAQTKSTSGRSTANAAPVITARAGVSSVNDRIQPGVAVWRWRVSHLMTPKTISAAPTTMRSHDAHVGGDLCRPPSRPETARKIAVRAARLTSHPARNARLLACARGACNASTAGMIDNGDSAITSARETSPVNSELQPVATRER